jgi:hypothetical protein
MTLSWRAIEMHHATIWLELAERRRALADGITDPSERRASLAIVADDEAQVRDAVPSGGSLWFSTACSARVW